MTVTNSAQLTPLLPHIHLSHSLSRNVEREGHLNVNSQLLFTHLASRAKKRKSQGFPVCKNTTHSGIKRRVDSSVASSLYSPKKGDINMYIYIINVMI